MKSATYFQNEIMEHNFCDTCNGDSVRMSKLIHASNGNNMNSTLNQKQTILYQKKLDDYSIDIDFDDDEKTNSLGLSRRLDGLYIDEKDISMQLNEPFVTKFSVASSSPPNEPFFNNASLHQSASISQLGSQQMKNFVVSGSNEIPINDIDNNILCHQSKIIDGLSTASFSSSSLPSVVKLSILNQNKEELTRLITATTAVTTTMTYSNSYGIQNNNTTVTNGGAMESPENTFKIVCDGNQNVQQSLTYSSNGHFINSPSRVTINHQQASQDLSLYLPPSLTTTDNVPKIISKFNPQNRHPPAIVERRTQSTPREQSTVLLLDDNINKSIQSIHTSEIGVPIRPRSLDRAR